jgi:hypothetical protein
LAIGEWRAIEVAVIGEFGEWRLEIPFGIWHLAISAFGIWHFRFEV